MNRKTLARVLVTLSVTMACVACRVAMETDFQNAYVPSSRHSVVSQMVLVATQETPEGDTKTALSGSQVVWNSGNQIKVFNAANPNGKVFTLTSGVGQTTGEFSGELLSGNGPFYAVYPASVAGTLSDGKVSITIPQGQELTAGSFGNNANISMAQTDNLTDALHFKNVLGAVCIQVTSSILAKRVRIQTKADEPLWGCATVQMVEGVPALTLAPGTEDNQIVEAATAGSASGTAFYLMLPPGTLASGFVAQVAAGEKAMLKEAPAAENNKIVRSGIVAMPGFEYAGQVPASFLNISATPFGYWSSFSSSPAFTFSKATSQYACKVTANTNRTFRMQDFSAGKMYSFVLPYTLVLGESYPVNIESVEGSTYTAAASAGTFRLVQKTGNAGWFVNEDNTKGFIILLED